MKLHDEINAFLKEMAPNIPEEAVKIMSKATEDLGISGIVNTAKRSGESMPAFSLPNALKTMVSSIDLLKDGPLVISFYRGSW